VRWGVLTPVPLILLLAELSLLSGCGPSISRYVLIEQNLIAGDPAAAAAIVEQK